MNVLLAAINAKYIHSNLAVYSLKAYVEEKWDSEAGQKEIQEDTKPIIAIAEYTINQTVDQILMDLYRRKPDMLCFSCYLWNIEYVEHLLREIPKILPKTEIWLGGPEVSWNAKEMLLRFPQVRGVMRGEGEETFYQLLRARNEDLHKIDGITFRNKEVWNNEARNNDTRNDDDREQETILATDERKPMDLSKIPFVYKDMDPFEHKIIYYESSRGCPFSCSYCLSSIDKCLRFRDSELVKRELQFFIDRKVPQVKFVDRTFNCRHDHAMTIWKYLAEHDNGTTNFHFEVAADLLNEEEIRLIRSMRPGLIQLEIGVQSTNERTIKEIRRTMKFSEVARIVSEVRSGGNIHQHLDLIAGLPYEDMESFHRSFNDVYALRPQQLQLGFLKVLKGSYMEEKAVEYQLVFQERPPFEVLSTKWLSYEDVIRLKGIEEMVEVHYNSGQFVHTMERLEPIFGDAFWMYDALRAYYEAHGLDQVNHSRIGRYEILWAFLTEYLEKYLRESKKSSLESFRESLVGSPVGSADGWQEEFREALTYDLYLRENVKNRPAFAGEETVEKRIAAAFYEREESEHQYLKSGYEGRDRRQMRKMTHLERIGGKLLLFDYQNRDALCNQARVTAVEGL